MDTRPTPEPEAAAIPQTLDAVLALLAAPLVVAGVLAVRLAVAAALILFILGWAAADACRRLLASGPVSRPGAATPAG